MSKKHKSEHPGRPGKDTPSERDRSSGVSHASEEVVRSGNLAFGHPPGDKGPARVISDVERKGVPATDTKARSARGVGVSEHRGAEKIAHKGEKGRKKLETDDKGRPYGVSRPEDITGVNPQKTITRDSP